MEKKLKTKSSRDTSEEAFSSHLVGKLADALHQVLVGLPVSGDHLSQNWDHLETVGVVKPEK